MIKIINAILLATFCCTSFYILTTPKLIPYRAPPENVWKVTHKHGVPMWYKSS